MVQSYLRAAEKIQLQLHIQIVRSRNNCRPSISSSKIRSDKLIIQIIKLLQIRTRGGKKKREKKKVLKVKNTLHKSLIRFVHNMTEPS